MSPKINWFTKSRRAQNENDFETWNEGGVVNTLNAFDNGDVRATTLIITDDLIPIVMRNREGKAGGARDRC